jgi:hypothetical protein
MWRGIVISSGIIACLLALLMMTGWTLARLYGNGHTYSLPLRQSARVAR